MKNQNKSSTHRELNWLKRLHKLKPGAKQAKSMLMLATVVMPFMLNVYGGASVAKAAITEAGTTDYCIAGSDNNSSSASSSSSGESGITVKIDGIDSDLSPKDAAKAIAKAVGEALDVDPAIIYGQLVQECGQNFDSQEATGGDHNLSGIKYASWMSSVASTGGAVGDGSRTGVYAKFNDWNGYASVYASLLKNGYPQTVGAKDATTFVHALKNGVNGQYMEADESQYLAGVEAGMQLYYGGPSNSAASAGAASDSDSSSKSGIWHKGDSSYAPDSLDTTWTTGYGSWQDSKDQDQDSSDINYNATKPEEVAKAVYQFLTQEMGFSGAGAAGVLGNMQVESSFNLNASNGTHFGLVQWSQSRLDAANLKGGDASSMTLQNQLNLLKQELNGSYKSVSTKVKSATSAADAAKTWDDEFEVSGGASTSTRQKYAQEWYEKLNGSSISASDVGDTSSTASAGSDSATTSSTDVSAVADAAKQMVGYFKGHYGRTDVASVTTTGKAPTSASDVKSDGGSDCSEFVWLAMSAAGFKVPDSIWNTQSMIDDANGSQTYLTKIDKSDAKAGTIVAEGGSGADGHTVILAENWKGDDTKVYSMGDDQGVVEGTFATYMTASGHTADKSTFAIPTGASNEQKGNANACSSDDNETSSGEWGWPFKKITSIKDAFSNLDGATSEQAFGTSPQRSGNFHDGWDFGSAKYGSGTDILAVHAGTVYKIANGGPRGWYVDVKSDDGYYEIYQEAFSSKSDIKVSEGDKVEVGTVIGKLTESHLHLGITKTEIEKAESSWNKNDGTWLNPVRVISGDGNSTTDDYGKTSP